MTHKRVAAVVISIWVFSALLSLINLCIPPKTSSFKIFEVVIFDLCFICTVIVYCRTYFAVHLTQTKFKSCKYNKQNITTKWQVLRDTENLRSVYSTYFWCFKKKSFHNKNTKIIGELLLCYIRSSIVVELLVGQRFNSSSRINIKRDVIRSPGSVGRGGGLGPELPTRRKKRKKTTRNLADYKCAVLTSVTRVTQPYV